MIVTTPNKPGSSTISSTVHVGLGSNLDNPLFQITQALHELKRIPETTLQQVSSFYETAPLGRLNQPPFINAVVRLQTTLSPDDFLERLRAIEAQHQRVRKIKNGPRTLDLDILTFNDWQIDKLELTIPHPRLCERAFVLVPLLEISPDIQIPGHGYAKNFLANVKSQTIERLCSKTEREQ